MSVCRVIRLALELLRCNEQRPPCCEAMRVRKSNKESRDFPFPDLGEGIRGVLNEAVDTAGKR
jgi:hypothetical protein